MITEQSRIGVISSDKCKPLKCHLECKKNCPVVKMGKFCIQISIPKSKVSIEESLCIGCGICVKKCPFHAITVVNFPKELNEKIVHQFGPNSFRLFRIPAPKSGKILGVVGTNGIGKSTSLKILARTLIPNLGIYNEPPDWKKIIKNFRGNDLQKYFDFLSKGKVKISIKPQYIDLIFENIRGPVKHILEIENLERKNNDLIKKLSLDCILEKEVKTLSGGELQRLAISLVASQNADVFLFDEITSYLDIKQRIEASKVIRGLLLKNKSAFVIVVEHDLAIVDYLSDIICCIYGKPGVYGVVTLPYSVREGINIYLSGFIPTENLRFRENSIIFDIGKSQLTKQYQSDWVLQYSGMEKTFKTFKLVIEEGKISKSEVIVLLGENGTGKTLFVKLIANILKPDKIPKNDQIIKMSYKPQKISPVYEGLVKELFLEKLGPGYFETDFQEKIKNPLGLESLSDKKVKNLSGGELQRLAIALCFGKDAELFLIDEPSAYLDLEQRLNVGKAIKDFISSRKKGSFIVEHDFMLSAFLADKVIVFNGQPSAFCKANKPQNVGEGMNFFLKGLEITFRKDPTNFRPRINKLYSIKDAEQKLKGEYYFYD